jgi:hypothetical protein
MRGKSVYLLGEILRPVGERKKKKNSLDNPCGDVWLNLKKSAEVIVLTETVRKDRTVTNFSSEGRWGNA